MLKAIANFSFPVTLGLTSISKPHQLNEMIWNIRHLNNEPVIFPKKLKMDNFEKKPIPLFWQKKTINKNYKRIVSFFFRHPSIRSTRMDPMQPLQWKSGHCLEPWNSPLRDGLWQHSLWNWRTNMCSQAEIPQKTFIR